MGLNVGQDAKIYYFSQRFFELQYAYYAYITVQKVFFEKRKMNNFEVEILGLGTRLKSTADSGCSMAFLNPR